VSKIQVFITKEDGSKVLLADVIKEMKRKAEEIRDDLEAMQNSAAKELH